MMRSSFVYGTRALAASMGAGLMLLMLPALGQSPKVGDFVGSKKYATGRMQRFAGP
jgi:hypothetical protein